jgi:putative membrane protein
MKSNWNKIILTIGVCSFTVAVAIADQQMQAVSEQTNNLAGTDTNNWRTKPILSQRFVWMAATTDKKEIHLGELALQKSDNSNVKSFAQRIISDHKDSWEKLQTIAEKEGLKFPGTNVVAPRMNEQWDTNSADMENPALERQDMDSPPHLASLLVSNADNSLVNKQMAVDWDSLSGVDFDRAFVKHMVAGHEEAIREFEVASASLQDSDLKEYADNTLPVLRDHLQMAQNLESQIVNSSYSNPTNSSVTRTGDNDGATNNWVSGSNMNTNNVATAEPHHWWQFWKH